mmetsp:Transcript_7938/g.24389  ORF Transcript_7938/g.24389 Transcript_7938/m.24389 type:complete len:296 (-) Transcript_7938:941-1828(-)
MFLELLLLLAPLVVALAHHGFVLPRRVYFGRWRGRDVGVRLRELRLRGVILARRGGAFPWWLFLLRFLFRGGGGGGGARAAGEHDRLEGLLESVEAHGEDGVGELVLADERVGLVLEHVLDFRHDRIRGPVEIGRDGVLDGRDGPGIRGQGLVGEGRGARKRGVVQGRLRAFDHRSPHLDVARHEPVKEIRIQQSRQLPSTQRLEFLMQLHRKIRRVEVRLLLANGVLQCPEDRVRLSPQAKLRVLREQRIPVVAALRLSQHGAIVGKDAQHELDAFSRRLGRRCAELLRLVLRV